MNRFMNSGTAAIVVGLSSVFGAITSQATIISVATYQMGDSDPGAIAGGAVSTSFDTSGNGNNLASIGSPTYSADHAGFGSLSMAFSGNSYLSGPTVSNNTENFGISLYVNASDIYTGQGLAINGSGCCSGFGLYLADGKFYGLYGGIVGFEIGAAQANTWTHIAIVNEGGLSTGYLNFVAQNSEYVGDPHPANAPVCCSPVLSTTIGSDGTHHFTGLIDQVNIFTFEAGAFRASDLVPVPEPASLALFCLGLAGLGFSRRKQA